MSCQQWEGLSIKVVSSLSLEARKHSLGIALIEDSILGEFP